VNCRKIQGFASAPLPIAMPWQPVSAIICAASATDRNVAVAEHGNALDRFHDAADAVVVHAAGEALFAGAPVDRDRRDADPLELAGEVRGGDLIVVPPEAHLSR